MTTGNTDAVDEAIRVKLTTEAAEALFGEGAAERAKEARDVFEAAVRKLGPVPKITPEDEDALEEAIRNEIRMGYADLLCYALRNPSFIPALAVAAATQRPVAVLQKFANEHEEVRRIAGECLILAFKEVALQWGILVRDLAKARDEATKEKASDADPAGA